MRAKYTQLEVYDQPQEDDKEVGPFANELIETLEMSEKQFGKAWVDDLQDTVSYPPTIEPSTSSVAIVGKKDFCMKPSSAKKTKKSYTIAGVSKNKKTTRLLGNNESKVLSSQADGGDRFETEEEREIASLMVFPNGFPPLPSPKMGGGENGENSSLPKSSPPDDDDDDDDDDIECERDFKIS